MRKKIIEIEEQTKSLHRINEYSYFILIVKDKFKMMPVRNESNEWFMLDLNSNKIFIPNINIVSKKGETKIQLIIRSYISMGYNAYIFDSMEELINYKS